MLRILGWLLTLVLVGLAVWLPTQVHQATEDNQVGQQVDSLLAAVGTVRQLPDFSQYADVRDKKQAFFGFLAPIVQVENARIEARRDRLIAIQAKWQQRQVLTDEDREALEAIAKNYKVSLSEDIAQSLALLLRRVDIVPEALVLVQAANESGWGTSRFAREGLNLFGQWCFTEGCGLVPDSRVEGMTHEVQRFRSINAAVRSYLQNINTHPAYQELRRIRAEYRQQGADIRALDLTAGLLSYSERGEEYIDELNAMIRVNRPIITDVLEASAMTNSAPE